MPVLPDHIIRLNQTIYVKLLKILGPLSVLIMISGISKQFDNIIYYIIFIISLLYILYRYVIAFYAIKQWFHYLLNGDFIVRNSPVELLGTSLKATFSAIRASATFTVGCGFSYALCHELDDILEKEGKEAYFVPKMKAGMDKVGITSAAKTFLDKIGIKDSLSNTTSVNKSLLEELSKTDPVKFEKDTGLSISDGKKIIDYLEKKSVTTEVAELIKNKKDIFK